MAEFFDPNSSGLAEYVKGWERPASTTSFSEELYKSVEAHEVGHTLGLRHNFRVFDGPAELPSRSSGGSVPEDTRKAATSEQHRVAALVVTADRAEPNPANEFKYASVMDYGFDSAVKGFHGIGTYDAAAIRFMYGQIQEVWDNQKVAVPDPRKYKSFARRCGHDDAISGACLRS